MHVCEVHMNHNHPPRRMKYCPETRFAAITNIHVQREYQVRAMSWAPTQYCRGR